jgi:murein DD-endopeptidase MepM/ murein hydrolase activator NlpD
MVPGGSKPIPQKIVKIYSGPVPANASRGTGRLVWPTSGSITQGYKPFHRALDIAAWTGAQVKASDSGFVVAAGWSDAGYGNYIVIDHRNGFQSLYGHLSRILVNAGDSVGKGSVIGLMGTSGRSTGPHLHFEVRQRGVQQNPFGYLP